MAISIKDDPGGPQPGKSGHFAHHTWLAESVAELAAKAVPAPTTVKTIDVSADPDIVLRDIVDVLVSLGVAKKKGA